jgi:hypothetical protein
MLGKCLKQEQCTKGDSSEEEEKKGRNLMLRSRSEEVIEDKPREEGKKVAADKSGKGKIQRLSRRSLDEDDE